MLAEVLEPIETKAGTLAPGKIIDVSEQIIRRLSSRVRLLPPNTDTALRGNDQPPVEPLPEWQHDLCIAHAYFNNWRGRCPIGLDDCIISKVIDSGGDLDQLRGLNLGHGITTDMVIDEWLRSNEPAAELLTNPSWFICVAEHLSKGENHV